jgi:serine/threonine-protein kinase RsbW
MLLETLKVAPMPGPTFSLTVPSELRMLSVARGFVEAVCEAYNLERGTKNALIIVTGEVITNIVRHAHQNQPGAQMEMSLEIRPEAIVLTFEDQGQPFDFEAVPKMPPGELRIGGRGVYLMRALMDEVTCKPLSEGQCGNVMRMIKRRPEAAAMRECG